MYVPAHAHEPCLDVFVLKIQPRLVGFRDDKKVETQGQKGNQRSRENIWDHHPVEADTAGKYGDDFRVSRHLGREEDYRDEYEQWAEHIHEIGHEIDVVVEND